MPQTVILPGPAPWGFRLSGGVDFNQPLVITRVGVGILAFAARWGLRRRPGGRSGCPGAEGGQKAREGGRTDGALLAPGLRRPAPGAAATPSSGCGAAQRFDKVRSKGVPSSGSPATFRGDPLGSGNARLPGSSASSPLGFKCFICDNRNKTHPIALP